MDRLVEKLLGVLLLLILVFTGSVGQGEEEKSKSPNNGLPPASGVRDEENNAQGISERKLKEILRSYNASNIGELLVKLEERERLKKLLEEINNKQKNPLDTLLRSFGLPDSSQQAARQRIQKMAEEEARRLRENRVIIPFFLDEKQVAQLLGKQPRQLRVIDQTDAWVVKEIGDSRWRTLGPKNDNKAILMYDATGQPPADTVKAVDALLDQIDPKGEHHGIVLVGNPKDPEYQRLKKAFGNRVIAEIDTRNKSRDQIHKEAYEEVRKKGGIAVTFRGSLSGSGNSGDSDDKPEPLPIPLMNLPDLPGPPHFDFPPPPPNACRSLRLLSHRLFGCLSRGRPFFPIDWVG